MDGPRDGGGPPWRGTWRGPWAGAWPGTRPPARGAAAWRLAVLVAAVMLAGTRAAAGEQPDRRPLDVYGLMLLVAAAAALAARVRAPVATLVVVAAATAGYYGLGYPYGPAFLALIVATVGAVVRGHRWAAWLVLAGAFAAVVEVWRLETGDWPTPAAVASHGIWVVVLAGVAELARSRAERIQEMRRARTELGRRQVSEERLRLARELHDVLAHNVSLINVQASTALHLFDDDPERARSALAAIKTASRETLEELRATVGALRAEGEDAPRSPTAGLSRLDALVAQSAAVGPRVTLERVGAVRPLPPRVDLAAYRIVQEALTNTRRHAGASRVDVRLTYDADALEVSVVDDGRGTVGATDGGHGLRGMRERAEALGGSLAYGPAEPVGFSVTARLPTRAVLDTGELP